ncbi:hypothetical protein OS493_002301 [Desmophyllum pertusum]|uniref:Uncharacterized protein n=1 Tax=Desmophyllum pertusum TaxID=174260 RepID=A0A9W9YU51_9CNID|nr:hypothetical protein OS493_002301 [Desmophyllum pertusum]
MFLAENIIRLSPYQLHKGYLCIINLDITDELHEGMLDAVNSVLSPALLRCTRKTYPSSLCYGFIFNLLVALCTIGFMCYFLYRFDSRLVSLERRLWDRQRNDGLTASRKPALFNEETHNKRRHFEKKNANDLEDSYFQRRTPLRKIREENVS